MLLTVTMNAAIDKTYRLAQRNTPGEVLRVQAMSATPGGKGLNVAKAAHALGEPVAATGFLAGHAGDWVQEQVALEGIALGFVRITGETRTCINIVEPDGRQTEFLEPGPEVPPEALDAFTDRFAQLAVRARAVTLSGSVPLGVPEDFYARLVAMCIQLGRPVLLDTSGALLRAGALARPDVIKPNLDELGQLTGHPVGRDIAQVLAHARALSKTGIGLVVVSMGALGAVAATHNAAWHLVPPAIKAVSATGSGDSFLAGLAVGIARALPWPDTLRLATAAAAANALNMETGRVYPQDVKTLLDGVRITALP